MKFSDTMKKIPLETSLDKANAQASALQTKRDRAIANFAMVDKNGNGKILNGPEGDVFDHQLSDQRLTLNCAEE